MDARWIWEKGVITPCVLRKEGYQPVSRSEVLPELDLALLARFVEESSQARAVRAYLDALKAAG
ncbi:MAG: hypothetical protein AB2A00_34125 [Myxococcota bacterium]